MIFKFQTLLRHKLIPERHHEEINRKKFSEKIAELLFPGLKFVKHSMPEDPFIGPGTQYETTFVAMTRINWESYKRKLLDIRDMSNDKFICPTIDQIIQDVETSF